MAPITSRGKSFYSLQAKALRAQAEWEPYYWEAQQWQYTMWGGAYDINDRFNVANYSQGWE
eukprot:3064716-Heterocapsa_arctica.AAC.1